MKKLKVLWITNQLFPEISEEIGLDVPKAGGWMYGLANSLKKESSVELHIATAHDVEKLISKEINHITFYLLPSKRAKTTYDVSLEPKWKVLLRKVEPDVIHIHGSEYAHGLSCINSNPGQNYVLSIQGLINECSKRYYAGISRTTILRYMTFRDILRFDTIFQAKRKFSRRGKNELKYLHSVKHVMGRTDWDLSVTKSINPDLNYFHCEETMRSSFYESEKWNVNKVERNTIFISQAYYPLKGLHQLIKSLDIVKKEFPQIKLRIAGGNIIKTESLMDRIKLTGYGNYILALLKKYDLQNHVEFLGTLSEKEMIASYLSSNLFVCPSSIENSSNSISEAQLLGVPCIASFVGGNGTLVNHKEDGLLYPFDDVALLAQYIKNILLDDRLAQGLSDNAIKKATARHDKKNNVQRTVDVYQAISNKNQ